MICRSVRLSKIKNNCPLFKEKLEKMVNRAELKYHRAGFRSILQPAQRTCIRCKKSVFYAQVCFITRDSDNKTIRFMPNFLQVALPLPIDKTFVYRFPPELQSHVQPGCRAVVPFGRRVLTGIIVDDPVEDLPDKQIRDVLDLPDIDPLLPEDILQLAHWIKDYYLCSWGEALKAALPSGHLKKGKGTAILIEERISAADGLIPDNLLKRAGELDGRAPRQAEMLRVVVESVVSLPAGELLQRSGGQRSALKSLLSAGLLQSQRTQVKRYPTLEALSIRDEAPLPTPNEDQQKAIETISRSIEAGANQTFLLYGVTGSGKTLVYQKAIEEVIEQGGTALVLIPEISLTPQLVGRFRSHFGDRIALQHSAMPAGERLDVWNGIRSGEFPVVIGARSALFAPLKNLKLIVVDEEGDSSFKQNEPNPRYNARDAALVRAKMNNAVAILGSATPSLESFYNAEGSRYTLLELPTRVDNASIPEINFTLPSNSRTGVLGKVLKKAISEKIANGEQVILLHNRRGFFTFVFCPFCDHILQCRHCEISLTYHHTDRMLRCHVCGYDAPPPRLCPECSGALRYTGSGTQRLEDDLKGILPLEETVRLDADTTQRKGSHHSILKMFAAGEKSVLLGTKMVARGHDYPRVTLVGIVAADAELFFPDFRSDERSYAMFLQAAGRAGRSAENANPAQVLVQTWMPENRVLQLVKSGDYRTFYEGEIKLRRSLGYPPCGGMILFVFSAKSEEKAKKSAKDFILKAKQDIPRGNWLGPAPAFRLRVRDRYRYQVFLKFDLKQRSPKSSLRVKLREMLNKFKAEIGKDVNMTIDVDPIQLL
ncbi:primosomal protein N' [candidate division LCP-89 bacterium B3_LCP]|uniref:Replication restart protein PriA n=1 Tax=candidate division LCP-89 bacterium B3_LCP TaxID=2012998 RepID=A0A532UYQ4_UNCL8|nr:MAG: primosomal protein N' [candidate division LCP-89 bacterium B3_LCP]